MLRNDSLVNRFKAFRKASNTANQNRNNRGCFDTPPLIGGGGEGRGEAKVFQSNISNNSKTTRLGHYSVTSVSRAANIETSVKF